MFHIVNKNDSSTGLQTSQEARATEACSLSLHILYACLQKGHSLATKGGYYSVLS